ncbi:uncharacterized protein LOC143281303 isoform X3 [Babylonia areolata]|uniref:uncharacterized protein LOC143281303 isoform X3 n=1 Tax=Babylonia areolata TaxID=304850 RepID=UPI003FD1E94E
MKAVILVLLPAVAVCLLRTGGITDTTVSPSYEPVLFAVRAINEQYGFSSEQLHLLEIVRARTQVVAGEKLYLTLHLTGDYYCDVNVWYRAWLQGDERLIITDGPTCSQHQPAKRARVGGIGDPKPLPDSGDAEGAAIVKALEFAACSLNDRMNSIFSSVLGDTSAVTYTSQVTAGLTLRFKNVPMVSTNCRNQGCAGLDLQACPADAHGLKQTCSFTVQYQAWMTPKYTLLDFAC